MISKIYTKGLFAKLFTLGLLLLFADALKDFFYLLTNIDFSFLGSVSLFVIGVTLCLLSLPFLMIEWLTVPFGTQTKRIKLYQGAGNLFAFAMLVGGRFINEQPAQNALHATALILSTIGLATALLFGWTGRDIADFISRKKITSDKFGGRNSLNGGGRLNRQIIENRIGKSAKATETTRFPAAQI